MNSKTYPQKVAMTYTIMRIIVAVLMVASLLLCVFGSYAKVQPDNVGAIVVDMMGLIVSVILLFGIGIDSLRIKQDRALARLITVMCFILFFDIRLTFVEGRIGVIEADITQVKIEYALLGICHALILYCYWAYIREEIHLSGKFLKSGNIICKTVATKIKRRNVSNGVKGSCRKMIYLQL